MAQKDKQPVSNQKTERTLLRKLTLKSVPGVNPFPTQTVEYLLLKRKLDFLKLVYYSKSQITFFDDVLDKIGITSDKRIPKPGKNDELAEPFKQRLAVPGLLKREYIRGTNSRENFQNSKANLKARNQGKK